MQSGERQEEKHDSAVVLMRLEREREILRWVSIRRACPMSTTEVRERRTHRDKWCPGGGRM
jgi:hypothetical protein